MFIPFRKEDILHSTIKAYPEIKFFVYDRKIYYNNKPKFSGSNVSNVGHVDTGYLSLYEENIDRPSGQLIYPFVTKNGSLTSFKTVTTSQFNSDFSYGDIITGSYPLYSTISRTYYSSGQSRSKIEALQNTFNNYKILSPHFAYNSSLGDKSSQVLNVIEIPSIFYGSSIKKGSIDLKFYISGSLIGRLQDVKRNGELIQTGPIGSNGSGSCAGIALYNEGFMILTSSWDITTEHTEPYIPGSAATFPKWTYFASLGSTGINENLPSSSFDIYFQGTQYINNITMLCHAHKGKFNFSNNPTYLEYGQNFNAITSSYQYVEPDATKIKNIEKFNWSETTSSFLNKTTYIDKVLLWDEQKNLIGVAKLARPLRKREKDEFLVKLKYDVS